MSEEKLVIGLLALLGCGLMGLGVAINVPLIVGAGLILLSASYLTPEPR